MLKLTEVSVCVCMYKVHYSKETLKSERLTLQGLHLLLYGLCTTWGLGYCSELGDCLRKVLFWEQPQTHVSVQTS